MLQLNPPLPMQTPKGEGLAHILIDYGPESDLYWTVFITGTGEIWTFSNREVRASKNITLGRTQAEPPLAAAGLRGKLGKRVSNGLGAGPLAGTDDHHAQES